MTQLDEKLREIALMNWDQFVSIVGKDAIIRAKVCLLRQNKNSYTQISIKLGITKRKAELDCIRCTKTTGPSA